MRNRLLVVCSILALISGIAVVGDATGVLHQWSTPLDVTSGASGRPASSAISADGDAVVASGSLGILEASLRRSGTWTDPIALSSTSHYALAQLSASASDGQGRLVVAWVGLDWVTQKFQLNLAVSQPGSTEFDVPIVVSSVDRDSIGVPSVVIDGQGIVIVASNVSSNSGATHSVEVIRCDMTSVPLCEMPTTIAGTASSEHVPLLQASPALSTVVWANASGHVFAADITSAGLQPAIEIGQGITSIDDLAGWSANGLTMVEWTEAGARSRIIRDASGWGNAASNAERVVDLVGAPDGSLLMLSVDAGNLLRVASTIDGILFTDVQQLASNVLPDFEPPSIRVASDGSAVAVWSEDGTFAVRSAVRVDGNWTVLPSLGAFEHCGGDPILARGVSDQAIAAWGSDAGATPVLLVEMMMAEATTSTTSTTIAAELAPIFAC